MDIYPVLKNGEMTKKSGLAWVPAIKYKPTRRKIKTECQRPANNNQANKQKRKRKRSKKSSSIANILSKSRQVSKLTSRLFLSKWPDNSQSTMPQPLSER